LHHDFVLQVVELLENVGVEQRGADVVEPGLQLVEVKMQALIKNFIHGAELQFRDQPPGQFLGVIAKAAVGTPEMRRNAWFNWPTQKRTDRGNHR
jgi:hypothetical protein